ncbi:solute carrier family 22 member 6-B-like isoform X3 [Strigops habroptila]|uniref:solute carrier family 22 member 6-B-like isoform X3 n=1 Tax=Strigops habroptila TaxID=2489341 RepID=UPI0011CEDCD8|nr:solute carrier family 22 member 6-B-like isoform X3 [Strigops habroptila]
MSFAALLARLGGMGRFQVTYVAALAVPLIMLASHNLLQNFTAGVPEHHCRPRATGATADIPLLVSIPTDGHQQPQRCRRYVELQWHLLEANATANGSTAATEPCRDGWTYRDGAFAHTIVTEWDLVCESKTLKQMAQSIYMAGILLGSGLFGILSDKHGVDPNGGAGRGGHHQRLQLHAGAVPAGGDGLRNPALALAAAHCVPALRPLLPLLLAAAGVGAVAAQCGAAPPGPGWAAPGRAHQRPEARGRPTGSGGAAGSGAPGAASARGSRGHAVPDTWNEDGVLWSLLCLVLHQLCLLRAGHGPAGLWGERVPEPAALRRRGHPGQADLGVGHRWPRPKGGPRRLLGARWGLHPGQQRRAQRAAGAANGLRCAGEGLLGRLLQLRLHLHWRALPHRHQTGLGLGGTMARVGGIVAPLVRMTADVSPVLPLLIYGAAPIVSAMATRCLPETRSLPLPETVADVETRTGHLKDKEVTVPLSSTSTKDSA